MIRYWLSGEHDLVSAACCMPRSLRRLSGCGPWAATHENGRTALTMQRGLDPAAWGPEQQGTGGLIYQIPDPLPEFDPALWVRRDATGTVVSLSCGIPLPIPAAHVAGSVIRLDGTLGTPRIIGGYAKQLQAVLDRAQAGDAVQYDDPDVVELCRTAIRGGSYLTDELIHAWELLSTADVDAIICAAAGV
jgi:hypothetical protein